MYQVDPIARWLPSYFSTSASFDCPVSTGVGRAPPVRSPTKAYRLGMAQARHSYGTRKPLFTAASFRT